MRIRFDRLSTLYLFSPLKQMFAGRALPILMYHSISTETEKSHPYFQVTTTPEAFARQMRFLHENGYQIVGLDKAKKLAARSAMATGTQVVLTFDDGYYDFYANAFPILQRYGFTATVFLPTAYIANERMNFKQRRCLAWREVRELSRAGIEFGSHTVSHPELRALPAAEIEREIRESKARIEDQLGRAVRWFSLPYACPEDDEAFKRILRQLLEKHGYEAAVSTILGSATADSDPFLLERLPVNTWDDEALFAAKLAGGYDWLHTLQYASKFLRSQFRLAPTQ